jgi:hypothetical protein
MANKTTQQTQRQELELHRIDLSTLAHLKVWEQVTMKRIKSVWISRRIEPIDFNDVPIIFYVRVAE